MTKYIVFLVMLSTQIFYAQSGWTKNNGEGYSQLSYTTISGYDTIFGDPEYTTEREITDNTLQIYSEYGLTDKTTIILNVPIKFIKTGQLVNSAIGITTANSTSNLGNIEIGLKHQIYNKKWAIAGQLNVAANTGSFDNPSGIRSGIDAWSFTPTINFSRSFKGFYAQGFAGISIRTNNYSNNFKIGGEVGTKPFKNVLLIGFIDVVKSFKDGEIILPPSNQLTALYVNDQEYGAFGFKAISEVTNKFGVNLGFAGAFFGNNVAKKAALTYGVYQKF